MRAIVLEKFGGFDSLVYKAVGRAPGDSHNFTQLPGPAFSAIWRSTGGHSLPIRGSTSSPPGSSARRRSVRPIARWRPTRPAARWSSFTPRGGRTAPVTQLTPSNGVAL
jgi:hypothetical protein